MSAPNITPYVVVPRAVYEARDQLVISLEQFHIFQFGYWQANRKEGYRVAAYSAARVCRFVGLDATKANLKRYQRAADDLVDLNLIRHDYRKINPRRVKRPERTYSIWVPNPDRFQLVGSSEENAINLWSCRDVPASRFSIEPPFVALLDTDNVALPQPTTNSSDGTCERDKRDNVALVGEQKDDIMSIPYQGQAERETPHPPKGASTPAPLPLKGENAQAPQGFKSKTSGQSPSATAGKESRSLDAKQCERLQRTALLYCDFVNAIYDFVPDADDVASMLRDFTPTELLYAQIEKFTPHDSFRKNDMAYFFMKTARTLILAARENGTSQSRPAWFERRDGAWREVLKKWRPVAGAYRELYPDCSDDGVSKAAAEAVWRCRVGDFIESDACQTLQDIDTWLKKNPRDDGSVASRRDGYVFLKNVRRVKPKLFADCEAWRVKDRADLAAEGAPVLDQNEASVAAD